MPVTATAGTFETNEPSLGEYLHDMAVGAIQLPDFQRPWVWGDEAICSLIASVTLAYPIGAVMMLETGGEGSRFLPRLFAGIEISDPPDPRRLVLDGQQRLTSLYRALMPIKEDAKNKRYYYLDMAACLDPDEDRYEAVVSVPANKIVTGVFGRDVLLDLSTTEQEYTEGMFPLNLTFDTAGFDRWKSGYMEHFTFAPAKVKFLMQFQTSIWLPLQQYRIPVIELRNDTPKVAVCQVFEKVNTGGVTLTAFEIVTATFAADGFRLRKDWDKRRKRLYERHDVLRGVGGTEFLQAVTLAASYKRNQATGSAVNVRRRDLLALSLDEYKANADSVERGLSQVARLLNRLHILDRFNLPYGTQLIPLAAVCACLGDGFERDSVHSKLARWYWCGVFGELYGGANETRYAWDIQDLMSWITDDEVSPPRTVGDAELSPMRLLGLQTRQSAAYKGLFALMVSAGSLDFRNGDPIELTTRSAIPVDIHHIFPRAWYRRNEIDEWTANCVVNKAPLTSLTNQILGGVAPSRYLRRIVHEGDITEDRLHKVLRTHLISPELLRANDFHAFLRDRAIKLLDAIEDAMGKPVQGRDSEEVIEAFKGTLVRR